MTEFAANHCSSVPLAVQENVKALGISPEECQSKDGEIVIFRGIVGCNTNVPLWESPMGTPYSSWVFMGYNPQESLENTINTLGGVVVSKIFLFSPLFGEDSHFD